ncbi:hypothetical protein [Streptomyces netropsis]|uniref:Uncharacterized protein n=1 Tax=Streptomyces netropsis TaxID=55404 RepID=A0A7W7L5U6_STRNE|nr:hypothetical protein [Streptomyces netropsis]MBB4884153.1 hypothetical protein [Streptomyces netropsis]GGR05729.1 hypothetical protein GCM10010219_07650 [Streptomyces netropsis]
MLSLIPRRAVPASPLAAPPATLSAACDRQHAAVGAPPFESVGGGSPEERSRSAKPGPRLAGTGPGGPLCTRITGTGEFMRRGALPKALLVCAVLVGMYTLTACQGAGRAEAGTAVPPTGAGPTRSGQGPVFLAAEECASRGRAAAAIEEVTCAGPAAAARVLARFNGPLAKGPRCPAATDYVLHITAVDGVSEEDSAPEGYACMRNLRPPHPGDPGMGGGPLTVVGDCVYTERRGVVKETACDGSPARPPEYLVTRTVRTRADCPPSTALYVQVGGGTPVGCARRLA